MNQQAFEAGKAAYKAGNLTEAMARLNEAKQPGEVSGAIDHMMGNCLMRLGRYVEAASAYGDALQDSSYGNSGALACNRGRALLAAGKPQEAIASLTMATKDESYATPYKAYIALGNAYLKVGNAREAGVAFRNAAIDEANPEPAGALRSLGNCFMQLGRPIDAVEAYRTALDFSAPASNQDAIFADLGMAYVAANRMQEAVDAFAHATQDGYVLGPEHQSAYDASRRAVTASSGSPSETDALLLSAGYGMTNSGSYDPLDPLGESGEFMPSPEDTGFFSITEEELLEADRRNGKKGRRKKRGGCLRTIFFLLLMAAIIGGAFYAVYRGFGWPTQEAVAEQLFTGGAEDAIAPSVNDRDRATILSLVPPSGNSAVHVTGKDPSLFETKVFATVTLAAGGEQSYQIDMVRDGFGWKVSELTLDYVAQDADGAVLTDGLPGDGAEPEADATVDEEPKVEPELDAEAAEPTDEQVEGEEGGEDSEASNTTEGSVESEG